MCVCVCVSVCVCVRACVRACVRVCVTCYVTIKVFAAYSIHFGWMFTRAKISARVWTYACASPRDCTCKRMSVLIFQYTTRGLGFEILLNAHTYTHNAHSLTTNCPYAQARKRSNSHIIPSQVKGVKIHGKDAPTVSKELTEDERTWLRIAVALGVVILIVLIYISVVGNNDIKTFKSFMLRVWTNVKEQLLYHSCPESTSRNDESDWRRLTNILVFLTSCFH